MTQTNLLKQKPVRRCLKKQNNCSTALFWAGKPFVWWSFLNKLHHFCIIYREHKNMCTRLLFICSYEFPTGLSRGCIHTIPYHANLKRRGFPLRTSVHRLHTMHFHRIQRIYAMRPVFKNLSISGFDTIRCSQGGGQPEKMVLMREHLFSCSCLSVHVLLSHECSVPGATTVSAWSCHGKKPHNLARATASMLQADS